MEYQYSLLLLLLLATTATPTIAQQDKFLTYETIDPSSNKQTTIHLSNDQFQIQADSEFLDGLSGTLLSSPWNVIEDNIESVGFFNLDSTMENYTVKITISIGLQNNTISLDTRIVDVTPQMGQFLSIFTKFKENLLAPHLATSVWPADIAISVLESYVLQYDIKVLFIRGNDLLTMVDEYNVTLIAGEINQFGDLNDLSWIKSAQNIQTKKLSIASGGQSAVIDFDTFSLGSSENPLNYDEIGFAIFMGTSLLIHVHLFDNWRVMAVNSDVLNNIPKSSNTNDNLLPIATFSLTIAMIWIISIVIRNKNVYRN